MPTVCCAIGCKHATGNGVCHLKRFPNDEKRALIWAENIRGSNWCRKGWELLCECHFESSQFEKTREDGARKLKHNAIPTLFPSHTVSLDDITTKLLGTSATLECLSEPYDLAPLSDAEIQKLPDSVPLIFPEEADFLTEAHFEDSAYESHRADGLKKLKQNAVPTISVSSSTIRSKRKQTVQPRLEFSFDEGGEDPIGAKKSVVQNHVENEQFHTGGSYGCSISGMDKKSSQMKGLKTVHIMEIIDKPKPKILEVNLVGSSEFNGTEKKGCEGTSKQKKSKRTNEVVPVAFLKFKRRLKLKGRVKMGKKQCQDVAKKKLAVSANIQLEDEGSDHLGATSEDPGKSNSRCFVCDKVIAPGFDVHLDIPAEASRTVLRDCLEAVLSFECSVSDHEVVCRRCCSLLNYIDRTEAEVALIKGAISVCVKLDLQHKSNLEKSERLLDRFSRGVGEKNYVMDLEELFLEQADGGDNDGEINGQPVSVGESSCEGVNDSPKESEKVAVNTVQNANEDVPIDGQVSNVKDKAASQRPDHNSNELQSLGTFIKEEKTLSRETDEMCGLVMGTVETGEIESYSKAASVKEMAPASNDLKHYLGGQQKTHECKICCFKTNYESVMIWHLRGHMKSNRWCDFCCDALPEKESMFAHLKKMKPIIKANIKTYSSKPKVILPAIPVEASMVSQVPLSSFNEVSSESPVVLVDTQSLGNESVLESEEKGTENVKMEDSQDGGVVFISENVFLSETTDILQSSIPVVEGEASVVDRNQTEHFCSDSSLSPSVQETEALEIYCRILRPPGIELDKVDNADADVVLNECLSNCCDVDESNRIDSLSGEPCDIPARECVHPTEDLEDSMETNFLDTLSSQPITKYPAMLSEICDEGTDQDAVSPVCGVSDDNLSNNDVNFSQNNAIGESDLALAYENSVAALMCPSDDSDEMLY